MTIEWINWISTALVWIAIAANAFGIWQMRCHIRAMRDRETMSELLMFSFAPHPLWIEFISIGLRSHAKRYLLFRDPSSIYSERLTEALTTVAWLASAKVIYHAKAAQLGLWRFGKA